jgi:ubiquinone/menaquinone biosynthesis C-methylase UbiE
MSVRGTAERTATGTKARSIRKPRSDDSALWDVVFGAYGKPAVMVAHKLGLFPLLDEKPRTTEEVCGALKIAQRPAETLLAVSASLGFVRRQGERFRLTALSEDYLLPGSPTYFGSYFDLIINNYSVCSIDSLEKAVLTDQPQVYGGAEVFKSHQEQAELARNFTRAMHSISMGPALAWPSKLNLSKHRVMLDIAGGSGAHSIGATLKWPKLQAVVFDLAPVCEVAREFAAMQGPRGRIATHVGDMWKDPFPEADVHFYSNIFHDWSPEKCRFLARKSSVALSSGGRIIVHEALYNNQKTGPFTAGAYSMIMLGWTAGGRQHAGKEIAQMLNDAGFTRIQITPTFGVMSIVTGRKP